MNSWSFSYDGEKNLGEIGPARNYLMNYPMLRIRSWQAYVESEIAQIVLNKDVVWVIGEGLKLRASPARLVLEQEGVKGFNSEAFNEEIEARFSLYSSSKRADWSGRKTLNQLASLARKSSIIGGDMLVILRVVKGQLKVQLIDGQNVSNPVGTILKNVTDGVEYDDNGRVVAYHVQTSLMKWERIVAVDKKSGMTMAYMVYGSELRIGSYRGMPLIGTVLETLKKLERYKEATVGSAEEVAKVAYQAVHSPASSGENPLSKSFAKAFSSDGSGFDDIPLTDNGAYLNNVVAATNNKSFINNPVGAEIKILKNENPLYFKDFYTVNIDLVCAAIGIPPEVAMSAYNSNFSASHAARGDWSHALNVTRLDFATQFYQPIYNLYLHLAVLTNKIQAPQYLTAFAQENFDIIESYQKARWIGVAMPHIDPFKVVKAERAKLGSKGDDIPLTTVEAATEVVGGGDSDSNLEQFAEELAEARRLNVVSDPVAASPEVGEGTAE
jgi:capsid protein